MFDSQWYLQRYPDVAQAGLDPISHYLGAGWKEGRDPGPMFTTSAYLKANEDVSASGMNPLLHFIQFGMAEGREGFGDRRLIFDSTEAMANFAEPHECFSIKRAAGTELPWTRTLGLDRAQPSFVAVGETGGGYVSEASTRSAVQVAVEWLQFLSGVAGKCPSEALPPGDPGHRLIDAWYVNSALLRTRWEAGSLPLVVRAFQCTPASGREPMLVGEGAVTCPIDVVNLHLLNGYFPLLFLFTSPDGEIRGAELLVFPSLCRGGTHYPELLWASTGSTGRSVDAMVVGRKLSANLIPLRRGIVQAAVGTIEIDSTDADGTGPLFRSDLRAWLSEVLQVEAVEGSSATRGDRAAGSGNVEPRTTRRDGGALLLPADAAPTIAALVAHHGSQDRQGSGRPVPLLASHIDPSVPALSIDVPAEAVPALDKTRIPLLMPSAEGLVPGEFPAAAIRVSARRQLSDAQLLVPNASPSLFPREARRPIAWLVDAESWSDDQLALTIHTIALQLGAAHDTIAFCGPVASGSLARTRLLFPGGVVQFKTCSEAVRQLTTPLVGHVGQGVLLHDQRTADCFSSLLVSEMVATASCVIVSTEKRAGVVKTIIVDGGALARNDGQAAVPAESALAAAELWEMSYPVLRPSPHLWATRSDLLRSWSGKPSEQSTTDLAHLCSSALTASLMGNPSAVSRVPAPPEAIASSTKIDWFVG